MDIIAIFVVVTWTLIMPFGGGVYFFITGINALVAYDPEFDKVKKKHSAILDIVLGAVLLLFFNLYFWLIIWPLFVAIHNLNLPTFDTLFTFYSS